MDRLDIRLQGGPAATQRMVVLIRDYIDSFPLPRDNAATVLVAGGVSMVKEDQLPGGAYPGQFWHSLNYTYEPKPPSLLEAIEANRKGEEPEPGEPAHRFQVVKMWWPHNGDSPTGQPRDSGIAWQIELTDNGFMSMVLVDKAPYNVAYFFSLLGSIFTSLAISPIVGIPEATVAKKTGSKEIPHATHPQS